MARVRTTHKLKQTIDHKMGLLLRSKEHLSKFIPIEVRQQVEAGPDLLALERRERDVSVLFVDLKGYSKLSAIMDQERVDALVERYVSQFLDCFHACVGDITETSGDGMMVIFQNDEAVEHTRKAARATLQMLEVTATLKRDWPGGGEPIAIHTGINSGVALVGSSRFEDVRGSRWTFRTKGAVTNLAARLGDAAAPGTILVGAETVARLADAFLLEACGPQTFKNLPTVELYRLVRAK
jgi:adenylate cyclase